MRNRGGVRLPSITFSRGRYRWRTWCRVHVPRWINTMLTGQAYLLDSEMGKWPGWRVWLHRAGLAFADSSFKPGREDCGRHEWYNADGEVERCYHCLVGVRPLRAEWRNSWQKSLKAASALYQSDPDFRADVNQEWGASPIEREYETMLISMWLGERAGDVYPGRTRRHRNARPE